MEQARSIATQDQVSALLDNLGSPEHKSADFYIQIVDLAKQIERDTSFVEVVHELNEAEEVDHAIQIINALLSELASSRYTQVEFPYEVLSTDFFKQPEVKDVAAKSDFYPELASVDMENRFDNALQFAYQAYQLKREADGQFSQFGIIGNTLWMNVSLCGYMALMVPLMLLNPVQCAGLALGVMAMNQLLFSRNVQSQLNDKQCNLNLVEPASSLPEQKDMQFDNVYLKKSHGNYFDYCYKVGDRMIAGQVELSLNDQLQTGGVVNITSPLLTKIGYNTAVSRMFYNYAATAWQDASLFGVIFAIGAKSLLVTAVLMLAPITWYLSTGITVLLVAKLVLGFVAPFLGCMLASSDLSKKASVSEGMAVNGVEAVSRDYPQKFSICGRILGLFGLNDSAVEREAEATSMKSTFGGSFGSQVSSLL